MSSPRKTTRRQFLRGQSAAEALADLAVREEPGLGEGLLSGAAGQNDGYLTQISRRAMACEFAVYLPISQPLAAESAVEALDLVEQLEDQLTVYRDHSEISQINRSAASEPQTVEPRLFTLLKEAVEIYRATDGAFDITAGQLAKVWGFYRREGRMPADDELQEALQSVGSQWLELDDAAQTIRFGKEGVEINLGGIGKGFALDRSVELLQDRGVENFLFHGGQSSVVARGVRGELKEGQSAAWTVGLRHPLRPERRLAEVQLIDRALGTSGSASQSFQYRGQRYGHILDPRNGLPAQGMLSSTVIAPTAALADALATAFYVMGVEPALQFCEARDDLAAILITPGSRRGSIRVDSVGLADDQWQCFDD